MNLLHTFVSDSSNHFRLNVVTIVKHFQERGLKDSKEIFYKGICLKMKPKLTLFVDTGIEFEKESLCKLYATLLHNWQLSSVSG